MKFEIKSRFSGAVLFSLETDSLKLCVEAAVESRANLSGAYLYGANLSRANLSGADLADANLSRANLSGAYLYGANLSRANLYGANLSRANLSGADLADANLSGADLADANLSGAYLSGAYLYGANLSRANLYGANLSGADLADANLSGAYLSGAYLSGANLSGADGKKLTLVGDRPFFSIGPIGSRNAALMAFLTDAGVYVRAGCFFDTLEAFEAAVAKTHGKTSNHAEEYHAAIGMIQWHAHHWTPKGVAP